MFTFATDNHNLNIITHSMKKFLFVLAVAILSTQFTGCTKKKTETEEPIMAETKIERYNRRTVRAGELADALSAEGNAGWIVQSAEYDGDDFVVTFERDD